MGNYTVSVGGAASGKSTCIDACARYFHRNDVAGVGNSIEKVFGISPLIGKMLWLASDVRKNFSLDAGDIQTMVSLELMSVAIKHVTAQSIRWNVPGIIAGNEIPTSWKSSLKSLERRVMLVPFNNIVVRNEQVKINTERERSNFYYITTCAYHFWQKKCGAHSSIWLLAPTKILAARSIIAENENPFETYLNTSSEIIVTGQNEDYVMEKTFKERYLRWCRSINEKNAKLPTKTDLELKFAQRGIKSKSDKRMWPIKRQRRYN